MNVWTRPSFVREMLDEYGARARAQLENWLPHGEPREYLYDLVADYPKRGGKMMRSTICLTAASAVGGRWADALNCAVSIELLHNALLIHDDIEDESEERRGRPALHQQEGIPLALNAGDALTLFSLRPLLDSHNQLGPQIALQLLYEADLAATQSAEGQALELGWRRDNRLDLNESDYLTMVLKKTCWFSTISPLRSGVLIGSRGGLNLDAFTEFGFLVGAAFQIQDDILNLIETDDYGKELNGDILEGKRTLMLNHLAEHCAPDELDKLTQIMALPREQKTCGDVDWVRSAMDQYGSLEYAQFVANTAAGAAQVEFQRAFSGARPSRELEFLESLPHWVIERD